MLRSAVFLSRCKKSNEVTIRKMQLKIDALLKDLSEFKAKVEEATNLAVKNGKEAIESKQKLKEVEVTLELQRAEYSKLEATLELERERADQLLEDGQLAADKATMRATLEVLLKMEHGEIDRDQMISDAVSFYKILKEDPELVVGGKRVVIDEIGKLYGE